MTGSSPLVLVALCVCVCCAFVHLFYLADPSHKTLRPCSRAPTRTRLIGTKFRFWPTVIAQGNRARRGGPAHLQAVTAICYSPVFKQMVTVGSDETVRYVRAYACMHKSDVCRLRLLVLSLWTPLVFAFPDKKTRKTTNKKQSVGCLDREQQL